MRNGFRFGWIHAKEPRFSRHLPQDKRFWKYIFKGNWRFSSRRQTTSDMKPNLIFRQACSQDYRGDTVAPSTLSAIVYGVRMSLYDPSDAGIFTVSDLLHYYWTEPCTQHNANSEQRHGHNTWGDTWWQYALVLFNACIYLLCGSR